MSSATAVPIFESRAAPAGPIERGERITAIDSLRGFALLGILLMNIIAMGLCGAAYDDPTVTGGAAGANLWAWIAMHVLAEGKMRCLFSMVFGASAILLTSRLEARRDAADIYYRRTLWLLLFGVLHAYLLWYGEILYPYALCGFVLYPFRKMRPRGLLLIGTVLLVFNTAAYIGMGFKQREILQSGLAAEAASKQGKKLDEEQEEAKAQYERWRKFSRPTAEELKKDAGEWRGNVLSVIRARTKIGGFFHSLPYYFPMNWDIGTGCR